MASGWNIYAAAASAPSAAACSAALTQHPGQHRYRPYAGKCTAAGFAAKMHHRLFQTEVQKLRRQTAIEKLPKEQIAGELQASQTEQAAKHPVLANDQQGSIEKSPKEQLAGELQASQTEQAGNHPVLANEDLDDLDRFLLGWTPTD